MMIVDLPRRWRWVIGVECAIAVVLLTVFVFVTRTHDVPVVEQSVIGTPQIVGVSPPAVVSERVDEAAIVSQLHGADEVQMCGGAWVRTTADGLVDQRDFLNATRVPQLRARILSNMNSSEGEVGRAAAQLLSIIELQDQHSRAMNELPMACEGGDCETAQQPLQQATTDVDQARDALARMAVSTSDPRAYALAVSACGPSREGACQLLSAEQWARLDPNNASPWIHKLGEAVQSGDVAAQDEALHRIATAQRSEAGILTVPRMVLNASPTDDASLLASWTMVTEAIGFTAAQPVPYQSLTNSCKGDALRDANRAQTCAEIAEVLADHSDTLFEQAIGVAIGRQVGWPLDRSDRMRGEYAAYVAAMAPTVDPTQQFSCSKMRQDLAVVRRSVTVGETGSLRDWLAQSGRSPEDFIGEERARRSSRVIARAQAASEAAPSRP
jgi:hypothetical protein